MRTPTTRTGFGPADGTPLARCSGGLAAPGQLADHVPLPLAEIYHTTFDWPSESDVQNRLLVPGGISELETARKLLEYHRNIIRILPAYPKILKVINADQPCVDVFYQGKHKRQGVPRAPRPSSSQCQPVAHLRVLSPFRAAPLQPLHCCWSNNKGSGKWLEQVPVHVCARAHVCVCVGKG